MTRESHGQRSLVGWRVRWGPLVELQRVEQDWATNFLSLLCTRDVTILLHPPQKFCTIQMTKLRCRQLKQISPAQITSDGQSQEAYSGPLTPEHVLLRLWLTWLNSTAPVESFTHLVVVFWPLDCWSSFYFHHHDVESFRFPVWFCKAFKYWPKSKNLKLIHEKKPQKVKRQVTDWKKSEMDDKNLMSLL